MSKLSLVCDFQELYRYLIDDLLIGYCQKVKRGDFVTKTEAANRRRVGKREYLNDGETGDLVRELNAYFERKVGVKRIRNGESQTLETLVNEEALLFAKYLRGEARDWAPRVPDSFCARTSSPVNLTRSFTRLVGPNAETCKY